jgi:hypothetical protein
MIAYIIFIIILIAFGVPVHLAVLLALAAGVLLSSRS